uniref:Uncharacterized protein n=1 Tax=Avena sativa TaxID=4498 RepID=A0ACD5W827_AVESA
MKTFFLLALLSLVATTTFAQTSDVQGGDDYEQYQMEPIKKLQICQDYINQRCNPGKMPMKWYRSCQEVQGLCCQQLGQVPQQSLCKTICKGVQTELGPYMRNIDSYCHTLRGEVTRHSDLYCSTLQGEVTTLMERAKNLPYICNTPTISYCNIPTSTSGGCDIL